MEKYYVNLFKEEFPSRPLLEGMNFDRISNQEKILLELPFSEEEVRKMIFNMKGDKTPGPNGFTISFFQNCWEIVKVDLLKVFEEFHELEEFYSHLTNTFIALIPKKSNATELKDFRPISLLSSVYKIIVKVLMSRLKSVMKNIISQP